jgi:hypothetical protein
MENIPKVAAAATAINPQIVQYLKLFLAIALVITGISLAIYAFKKRRALATPENINMVQNTQLAQLNARWGGITQGNTGLNVAGGNIPSDQRLLINTSVFGTRLVGYLGPYSSGVFDEDSATRLALSTGARCLVLEIDHEQGAAEPLLIYRDAWGFKQSLNTGSLLKVAKSIAGRAFSPSNDSVPPAIASDPLFVILYFARTPNPATAPRDYIRFLGKVAEQLQPLAALGLGQTPQGDFRRQALESQMFFMPTQIFSKRIILMTNADTTPFRSLGPLGLAGEIGARQDLDLLVHARLYSRESPSGLGITSGPTSSTRPAAVITTPQYWLTTPPDRLADAVANTKQAWTLIMTPTADALDIDAAKLKKLLEMYGVHCVPISIFDTPQVTDVFTGRGSGPYNKTTWVYKPDLIRFIPPKPIVIQKANPLTNAGGGAITAPKF